MTPKAAGPVVDAVEKLVKKSIENNISMGVHGKENLSS